MPHSSTLGSYRLGAVKICGTTTIEDRDLAARAGADYFGVLIDVGYSPRSVTPAHAKALFNSPPIPGIALVFNGSTDRVRQIADDLNPFAIQLLGNETPEFVASLKSGFDCQIWKTMHLPAKGRGDIDFDVLNTLAEEYEDSGADILSLDTVDHTNGAARNGGSGQVGDWTVMRALLSARGIPGVLAGGLTPENVVSALHAVRPAGIDLCSGVEAAPGKKDPKKLEKLFEALTSYRS